MTGDDAVKELSGDLHNTGVIEPDPQGAQRGDVQRIFLEPTTMPFRDFKPAPADTDLILITLMRSRTTLTAR